MDALDKKRLRQDKKNLSRRQHTQEAREGLFIKEYIRHKYPDVYDEAGSFYNYINKTYPTKKDLRKTDEFKAMTMGYAFVAKSGDKVLKKPCQVYRAISDLSGQSYTLTCFKTPETATETPQSTTETPKKVQKTMELKIPLLPTEVITRTETVQENPSTARTETVQENPSTARTETVQENPSTARTETVQENPSTARTETVQENPSTARTETVQENPSTARTETVQENPSTARTETVQENPSTARTETVQENPLTAAYDHSMHEDTLNEEISQETYEAIIAELRQDPDLHKIMDDIEVDMDLDLMLEEDRFEQELYNLW